MGCLGEDLFDTVIPGEPDATSSASLSVEFLRSSEEDLYDLFEFQDAFAARYEMKIELRNADGDWILGDPRLLFSGSAPSDRSYS